MKEASISRSEVDIDNLSKQWIERLEYHKRIDLEKKRQERTKVFHVIYTLDQIHIYKPKIHNYSSDESEIYIKYIIDLYGISKELAIKKIKQYDNDIYKTIIFL